MDDNQADWDSFLEEIRTETERLLGAECDLPFFRGHFETNWKLTPSIFRLDITDPEKIAELEGSLITDFQSLCGQLYDKELSGWELIFEMRHAGIATRLLDWTENFANALFFAFNDRVNPDDIETLQPCIWILNPYKLNKKSDGFAGVPAVDSLPFTYYATKEVNMKMVTPTYKKVSSGPIAIMPPRGHKRMFAQKSVFTFHFNEKPLNEYYKSCVKKIEIPFECKDCADFFLYLAGVNEYSMFPDLDGLGAYMRKKHAL